MYKEELTAIFMATVFGSSESFIPFIIALANSSAFAFE
nr:MAG TPA: hypothetical protein [Caudoviricetes sp.]